MKIALEKERIAQMKTAADFNKEEEEKKRQQEAARLAAEGEKVKIPVVRDIDSTLFSWQKMEKMFVPTKDALSAHSYPLTKINHASSILEMQSSTIWRSIGAAAIRSLMIGTISRNYQRARQELTNQSTSDSTFLR